MFEQNGITYTLMRSARLKLSWQSRHSTRQQDRDSSELESDHDWKRLGRERRETNVKG